MSTRPMSARPRLEAKGSDSFSISGSQIRETRRSVTPRGRCEGCGSFTHRANYQSSIPRPVRPRIPRPSTPGPGAYRTENKDPIHTTTFSKDKRFKERRSETPGPQYIPSYKAVEISHSGCKFSSGRKGERRSTTPGPGRYDPNDKPPIPSVKFGSGPRIDLYKRSTGPGFVYSPNYKAVDPNRGNTVFGKEKQRVDYRRSCSPGFVYDPRLPSSNASVKIPKDKRFRSRSVDTPGPIYNPTVYDEIKEKKISFPKDRRGRESRSSTPGPGQYCIDDWITRPKPPAAIMYLTEGVLDQ